MYKVLYENIIIDVLDTIKYMRYLPRSNKFVPANLSNANCIQASYKNTYYYTTDIKYPKCLECKTVVLEEISETEYEQLRSMLSNNSEGSAQESVLAQLKAQKIQQMKLACNNAIVSGITLTLSDGLDYHFELTLEDQINLMTIESQIAAGASELIYHGTGQLCKLFSANDLLKVIAEANRHKNYHQTYFNSLRNYINYLLDSESVLAVTYGMTFPKQYNSSGLAHLLKQSSV